MTKREMELYRKQVKKHKRSRTKANYDEAHEYNIGINYSEREKE